MKGQSKGTQVAQEVKPVVTQATPKEMVGPIKSQRIGDGLPDQPD